jgi:hypothetical protein
MFLVLVYVKQYYLDKLRFHYILKTDLPGEKSLIGLEDTAHKEADLTIILVGILVQISKTWNFFVI